MVRRQHIVRVAGHEEDFGFGVPRGQAMDERRAAQLRHHDVGDDQVNGALVLLRDAQRLARTRGFEDHISGGLQRLA